MVDIVEWHLIRDIEDWEEFYGDDGDLPDEFPVQASWIAGTAVTVNLAVATQLVDYDEAHTAVVYNLFDIDTYGKRQ